MSALTRRSRSLLATIVAVGVAGSLIGVVPAQAASNADLGLPVFTGSDDPVPALPAGIRPQGTMKAIYQADLASGNGTDFWMDRALARRGADPSGDWLLTRGGAAFMREHDPSVIGFGGDLAYWDTLGASGFEVTMGDRTFTEVVARRVQTPSSFSSVYRSNGVDVTVRKYITQNNVAVANLTVRNTGLFPTTVPISVESPLATTVEGSELVGSRAVKNDLTTIAPRLSGDGLVAEDGALTGEVALGFGARATVKVQLGMVASEIPQSRAQYDAIRGATPQQAWTDHVRTYNQWWADNLPFIDVPDENIQKSILYRWWLLRYNFLDAQIPGNDFQFPTTIEGVLGYNNAIALTVPMFVDELKYLRDPSYAYGTWLSAGEASGNGRYVDNPGDPENWSNSYTQYISESAWQSYQVHGGSNEIVKNLAHYAEGDVKDTLAFYDSNDNGLIEYDWGALTGNDADAVSFDWQPDPENPTAPLMDRAESAYVYSNALAGASAYDQLGDTAKADEMRAYAEKVRTGVLDVLWNPERQLLEHRRVNAGQEHVPWKEINNYYPYSVGLMPDEDEYKEAFRLWQDDEQYPIFPFYTANQADKAAAAALGDPGSNNFSVINSTVNFRFLGSALRDYPSDYITTDMYKKTLYWNAWSHFVDGDNRWPDQNEFWADWNADDQQIDYRSWIHHTMLGATNWTVIEDVAGLQPRSDDLIELSPIDIDWKSFAVTDVNYRGSDLSIMWNTRTDGRLTYAGQPEGYSLFLDGRRVATVDSLVPFVYDPATGTVEIEGDGEVVSSGRAALAASADVDLSSTRVPELLQLAGRDLGATGASANLAGTATPSASFTAEGTTLDGARDGFTTNAPVWGAAGSGSSQDWYALEFAEPTAVDDVKLYFLDDRRTDGYSGPAQYTVQYRSGDQWRSIPAAKSPAFPQANYNHAQFPAVTTDAVRVLVTHQAGQSTALKEMQVFSTGVVPPAVENQAPQVSARSDASFTRPGQARLIGDVLDDGLPNGTLRWTWRTVSGPGEVTFDDPSASTTIARFSEAGDYRLRLTATDGRKQSTADVVVSAEEQDERVNVASFATPTASYTSGWENLDAVNDGLDPAASNSPAGTRWGTYPQRGEQWVEYTWEKPVSLTGSDVYFFDDDGGVQVPADWKLQSFDGTDWVDVSAAGEYSVEQDAYNSVAFDPVVTDRLRVVLNGTQASVGLVEWKVFTDREATVRPIEIPTTIGTQPELPATAEVAGVYADGSAAAVPVNWPAIPAEQLATGGRSFPVTGAAAGQPFAIPATVWVRTNPAVQITSLAEEAVTTAPGAAPALPATVVATFNDGSRDSRSVVTWDAVDPASYAETGSFTVSGTVAATSLRASATVTVQAPA